MSISLTKGQTISLTKTDSAAPLTSILLGLGWDEATPSRRRGLFGGRGGGRGDIDLDASAICLNSSGNTVDVVYYGKLRSTDGAIVHTGDNLTGSGDGDDERIQVDLSRIDSGICTVVLTITSYSGHTFDRISNAFVRVLDTTASAAGPESLRYDMSGGASADTAMVVAALRRSDSGWAFTAIGDGAAARTPGKIDARRYLN